VILFPAIDLKDGVCVRLEQGNMARATVFNRDPAQQAHAFETQGFRHLHVVDLDGAFAGKPMNVTAVERILETVGLCVQLGGGIRDMATIDGWLEKGVNRVIIGTAAVRDPALVKDAAKKHPKRVAVGLDARDGKVAVEGWAEQSELTVLDIARRFEDAGVAAIIYTDVARDGMLQGINWDATIALAEAISIPVVASGGLATSSTTRRRWRRGDRVVHHLVDPRTGDPAPAVWRTVSVAAASCVDANTASTAAIVLGAAAPAWLRERAMPARLVALDGRVETIAGWPEREPVR